MRYTKLGRTDLSVSRLVLGTMNFGEHTTEPDAHLILDRARITRDRLSVEGLLAGTPSGESDLSFEDWMHRRR